MQERDWLRTTWEKGRTHADATPAIGRAQNDLVILIPYLG